MNNPIVKILRFLLFFPICFLAMGLVNWGLVILLVWFMGLSGFWAILVSFFLIGAIWGLFVMISGLLMMLASFISPVKWMGSITISVLAIANGIYICYKTWTLKGDYSGWEIFSAYIFTVLILELTFALIQGSLLAEVQKERNE